MLIDARSLDILAAVHPDETHNTQHNVHVREDGTLEATNGHILARVSPVIQEACQDFPGATGNQTPHLAGKVLSSNNLAEVARAIKANKKAANRLPILGHAYLEPNGGDHIKATITDLAAPKTLTVQVVDCNYPDTEKAVPTEKAGLRFGIMGRYLKMLGAWAENGSMVMFEIVPSSLHTPQDGDGVTEVLGPIRFKCYSGRPITGVIAPMRP